MAVHKSDEQKQRRLARVRLTVLGGMAAGLVAAGGVVAGVAAVLPGPSDTAAAGEAQTRPVDASSGEALAEGVLGSAAPRWVFDVASAPGLVTVQVNISDVSVPVDVTVAGTPLQVANGQGRTSVQSDGAVPVEVALAGATGESPFRVRVGAPVPAGG